MSSGFITNLKELIVQKNDEYFVEDTEVVLVLEYVSVTVLNGDIYVT